MNESFRPEAACRERRLTDDRLRSVLTVKVDSAPLPPVAVFQEYGNPPRGTDVADSHRLMRTNGSDRFQRARTDGTQLPLLAFHTLCSKLRWIQWPWATAHSFNISQRQNLATNWYPTDFGTFHRPQRIGPDKCCVPVATSEADILHRCTTRAGVAQRLSYATAVFGFGNTLNSAELGTVLEWA